MPYLPDQFDERHVRWIYDAIRAIAEGNLTAAVLPEIESKVGAETVTESDLTSAKAARILSWIALEAIDALESLPTASQSQVAKTSSAWPVAVRPKVVTSLGQIEARLMDLRFAEGMDIDLNHSARSTDGKNVPVEESHEPGLGLARLLHDQILAFKASSGLSALAPLLPGCPSIKDFNPADVGELQFREDAPKHEREAALTEVVTAKVTLHFLALVAELEDLNQGSIDFWVLTALRWMQHQNNGALIHEVLSESGRDERLSPYIPRAYWESTKREAAGSGKNPARLLESNIRRSLKNGFRALAKS